MASHDDPYRALNAAPPPVPDNGAHFGTPSHSTPAPSYHSSHSTLDPPYPQHPYGAHQGQPPRAGASPFDSVFDDPAYPPDHRSHAAGNLPQQGLYQDTGYYGQGENPSSTRSHVTESIPLQDHSKNNDSVDHIYDASSAENGGKRSKNRGKVRLGELGMFGANKKRIPFVVYTFTVIQVAVFITEIVKNGRTLFLCRPLALRHAY